MPKFELDAAYRPTADQPAAIESLAEGIDAGERFLTLLGATGTGKTMTMAATIEAVQRPALVIAHNKTLAAQLCNEFRTYFPRNAVEYFVSYYDYYQPEAYVPSKDLYIEKDSAINQEIDRLRHAATAALFARRDVVIVASVSCIFGLGSPETYDENLQTLQEGRVHRPRRAAAQARLDPVHAQRHRAGARDVPGARRDARGVPRLRGDGLPGRAVRRRGRAPPALRPADRRGARGRARARRDLAGHALQRARGHDRGRRRRDRRELNERCAELEAQGKLLESHRLRQRTQYDMEMLRELGFCSGIENYSRILDGRNAGRPPVLPARLLPRRLRLLHRRVAPDRPADRRDVRGRPLAQADAGRLRVPPAERARQPARRPSTSSSRSRPQIVFVSATPGEYERRHSPRIVEQIVRPTGIVDPEVEVRETRNQIDDLMNEIRQRVDRDERTLVTTLTKKMAEDLTDYLLEMGFRVRYLHSEIDTLERIQIIRELRLGEFDVLVGVNLLREGLDLPEVSLVAILDADKEGFLRGETSLIQTIGRAARNVEGKVLMYADKETAAMRAAIGRDRPPARDPARLQRGARDHAGDDRQGDLRHRRVPAVRVQGAALAAPQARRSRAMQPRGDREDDRRARGGDAGRGRGAALRVRRQAARRDPRPQAPARPGCSRRSGADRLSAERGPLASATLLLLNR